MRDKWAGIVMIAGAKSDGNKVRKFSNERSDLTRLSQPCFGPEHVEQITGNTDEAEVWSSFDQPVKPVDAMVEISC